MANYNSHKDNDNGFEVLAVRAVDRLFEQLEHVLQDLMSVLLPVKRTHIHTRIQQIYPLANFEVRPRGVVERFQIWERPKEFLYVSWVGGCLTHG